MYRPTHPLLLPVAAMTLLAASGTARAQISVTTGYLATTINVGSELDALAVSSGGAYGDYVYAGTNGEVLQIDPTTSAVTTFATGLPTGNSRPAGAAFGVGDFGTDLYVADNGGDVETVDPSGVVSVFSTGNSLSSCNGLAFTPTGSAYGENLFVSDGNFTGGALSTVATNGTNATFTPDSGFNGYTPTGLAYLSTGVFAGQLLAVTTDGRLVEINPDGSVTAITSSGLGTPIDLALGSGKFSNYIYVTDIANERILRVDTSGAVTVFATGMSFTGSGFDADIRFSPDGDTMYVADNTQLVEIRGVPCPSAALILASGLAPATALVRRRRRRRRLVRDRQ